jgi:hypothetical protein
VSQILLASGIGAVYRTASSSTTRAIGLDKQLPTLMVPLQILLLFICVADTHVNSEECIAMA